MIPMPIIAVPFERITMDLLGPLPKGTGGFEYILMVIDYANRYPEVVFLRNTKVPTLAHELLKIFTRVRFPQEVLMDQFYGEGHGQLMAATGSEAFEE